MTTVCGCWGCRFLIPALEDALGETLPYLGEMLESDGDLFQDDPDPQLGHAMVTLEQLIARIVELQEGKVRTPA